MSSYRWLKLSGALIWLAAAYPLYAYTTQLAYDHLSSEFGGVKFLGKEALWLDTVLKLFFFASVWQAAMDALVLMQLDSNLLARQALMLGPEKYEEMYFYFADLQKDIFFPGLARGGRVDPSQLLAIVTHGLAMRGFKILVLLCRCAITSGGMYLNLKALPERHPGEPLNQLKYYVAYFELIALGWYWSILLYRLAQWAQIPNLSYMGLVVAGALEDIASWSCLQLLRNMSVSRLSQRVQRVMKECKMFYDPRMQYVMAPIEALGYLAGGIFGVLILAIKTTQIEFVAHVLMVDYSWNQVFRLVSFAMSMASIFNLDDERRFSVQRFLLHPFEAACSGSMIPPPMFLAWEQKLAAEISAKHGFWTGFFFMATLTADDYQKLLLPVEESQPPKLLRDLLTVHLQSSARAQQALSLGMPRAELEAVQKWAAGDTGPAAYFSTLAPGYTALAPLDVPTTGKDP